MKIDIRPALTALATCAALAWSIAPVPAAAQSAGLPSYAVPPPTDQTISGVVAGFDGKYGLTVRDDRGYIDNVTLRDGTIINPTGVRLIEGMSVTIHGQPSGRTFLANQVDTPYVMSPPPSYVSPYAYAYAVPAYYPVAPAYYGVGWAPWYGISASFYFGGGCCYGGWYGYHGGWYGYHGGWYGYHGGWNGYKGGYYGGYHGGQVYVGSHGGTGGRSFSSGASGGGGRGHR